MTVLLVYNDRDIVVMTLSLHFKSNGQLLTTVNCDSDYDWFIKIRYTRLFFSFTTGCTVVIHQYTY